MEDLLRKIGWQDAGKVPLSNKENAELEDKLQQLIIRKFKANLANESASQRRDALQKHLKYLKQETEQNQQLLLINKQQLESDQHNFKLRECEHEKLKQDIRKFKKDASDINERCDIKREHLTRTLEKLEKLKAESAWDSEALKAWEEALKKREEDNELLKKFSKQDEKKAKDLEAKRVNLQVESNARKEMIQKMVAEITNYEQIMERSSKMLNQLKEEKKNLFIQWQVTVQCLRQRDDDIKRINKELELSQEALLQQIQAVEEQENFYKSQLRNNQQLGEEIQELNAHSSRIRKELNEAIETVLMMTSEASTMKRSVMGISQELEKARTKSKMLTEDINTKLKQIKRLEKEIESLKAKHEETKDLSATSSERAKFLEDLIEYENKQTNVIASELSKTQNVLYRTQQKLEDCKRTAKVQDMEIQGFHVGMNILRREIAKRIADLEQAKEIVYDLDFRKCNIELKLSKLEGTVTDDYLEEMASKIKDLQSVIAQNNEIKSMLDTQITRLNEERRRLANTIAADNTIIEDLRNKLQNFILLYEGGLKQTAAAKELSQKKQVEENVLRLKVDNLAKGMAKQEKCIYNLQKYRLELETAMNERKILIDSQKDVLNAKKRNLEEELGRLRADIMGRNIKIKHIQSRYAVAMSMLGVDECGQPLSITHYKIKNAQEKYMLQMEGDDLDKKIKTVEREIVAMENTLKVVNYGNQRFRELLGPIGERDQEVKELNALLGELQDTKIVLRGQRKILKNRLADIESFQLVLQSKVEIENQKNQELQDLQHHLNKFVNNREESKTKIKRAKRHIARTLTTLSTTNLAFDYKDFNLKMLTNTNFSTMQQLKLLPKKHPETMRLLVKYFGEVGLEMRGSVIRSMGSSYSEEPVMSIYSSTSSEKSKIDYTVKMTHVDVGLDYPFTPSLLEKMNKEYKVTDHTKLKVEDSTSKLRGAKRQSTIPSRFSTFSAIYKVSPGGKASKISLPKVRSAISVTSSSSDKTSKQMTNSDESMHIPSSLFMVSNEDEMMEEMEEEEQDPELKESVKSLTKTKSQF